MANERLDQLLDLWMSERDRGVIHSATEICADCPELAEELSRRIHVVRRFEQLANMGGAETLVSQEAVNTSQIAKAPVPGSTRTTSMPASVGPFRPLEILGTGGMGTVFLAEDTQLGRKVAVKVMKGELAADPDAKHRFLREARAMATVEHDNIMTIYAVGEDLGTPYLVMPALKGETLDDRLRRENRLSVAETRRIGKEIAAGLAAAHSHGLIHRDIKPSNIWLEGKQGRVRILDFGLARPSSEDQRVTQSGAVLGTPAYMAPEQAAGTEATSRSDLFSLGAVLYQIATGVQPFAGPNMMATLSNLANRQPDAPHRICPEVPESLSELILSLIAKPVEQRPDSAAAVLESLHQSAETVAPQLTVTPSPVAAVKKGAVPVASLEPLTTESSNKRPPLSFRKFLAGGFAGFLALMSFIIYRIQTDNGVLVVEIDDEQVAAKLTKGGLEIEDAKTGRTWTIQPDRQESVPSGEYRIAPPEGVLLHVTDDSGTEFKTAEFKIKRGDQVTVRVTLEKANGDSGRYSTHQKTDISSAHAAPTTSSVFSTLNRELIPAAERNADLPREVVAVLGSSHGRTWGSPYFTTHGNLTFTPDGKWIAACDFSNVFLFDAPTLALRKQIPFAGHFLKSRRVAFSSDSRRMHVSGNSLVPRNTVTDLTTPDLKTTVDAAPTSSTVVAVSPDDQWMAIDAVDQSNVLIGFRDPSSGTFSDWQLIPDADGFPTSLAMGAVAELTFSPDGQWLISGHPHGQPSGYRIYRRQEKRFVTVAVVPAVLNQYIVRVAFSWTDDRKVALLNGADCVQLDLSVAADVPVAATGLPVTIVDALKGSEDIAVSADGQTWAASSNAVLSRPAVWVGSWKDGKPFVRHSIPVPGTQVGHVALSAEGRTLAVMTDSRIVGLYDLTPEMTVPSTDSTFTYTAVSINSGRALTVGMTGDIQLKQMGPDGTKPLDTKTVSTRLGHACISESGQRAVTLSAPDPDQNGRSSIQVWDIVEGRLAERSSISIEPSQAFSPGFLFQNGSRLFFGNQIWNLDSTPPKVEAAFSKLPPRPSAIGACEANNTVALAAHDGLLSIFQLGQSQDTPIASIQLPASANALCFSPDGSQIVTIHSGALAVLWKLEEGHLSEVARLPPINIEGFSGLYHTTTCVFSADGRSVFVGGWGEVVEWKLDDNSIGRHWSLPGFTWLSRTTDGKHLIFNNSNTTAWILRLTGE